MKQNKLTHIEIRKTREKKRGKYIAEKIWFEEKEETLDVKERGGKEEAAGIFE
jgi:hypothetical protein